MKLFNNDKFQLNLGLAPARPEVILLPAKPWFVVLTMVVAFFLNLLPWSNTLLILRPDFFALTLLYWCIRQPNWVGIGMAWLCGLFMDVVDANLIGQHALAYAILGFAAGYFYRRVLRFPLWPQALHILVLLFLVQAVVVILRLMSGGVLPNLSILLSSVTGALCWPLLSVILQRPQRPAEQ